MSRVSLEARGRRPAPPRPQVSPVRARPSGSLSKSHWPPEGLLHTGPTAEPLLPQAWASVLWGNCSHTAWSATFLVLLLQI